MQGYDGDNPNIELLKLRNFTIGKKISDEEVTGPHGLQIIVDLIGTMTPFVSSPPPSAQWRRHRTWPGILPGRWKPNFLASSSLSESRVRQTLAMNADGAASHRSAKLLHAGDQLEFGLLRKLSIR
jgi:hypothetical protein